MFIQREHVDEGFHDFVFIRKMQTNEVVNVGANLLEGGIQRMITCCVLPDSFGCMRDALCMVNAGFPFLVDHVRVKIGWSLVALQEKIGWNSNDRWQPLTRSAYRLNIPQGIQLNLYPAFLESQFFVLSGTRTARISCTWHRRSRSQPDESLWRSAINEASRSCRRVVRLQDSQNSSTGATATHPFRNSGPRPIYASSFVVSSSCLS
jgi:hypothetical protein